jgi:glycosyltransferase involved in cell wall biosynthesis
MRVLLITKTLAEFPEESAKVREISRLGIDITVVVPAMWRGQQADVRRLRSEEYEVLTSDCWFSNWRSKRIRLHLHFHPGISKVIASASWDLVHVDEEPMNVATYHALRECRKQNRRAIFTTWQNLMKTYPPPFNSFEKCVFKNAAGGIAGDQEALEILRRRGFRKSVTCVPQHGVDVALFRRQERNDLREKMGLRRAFVVGFVGQLGHWKGLDTLIRAVALLPKTCALVLVGSGPDGPRFRSLADELGLSERLRWQTWVDQLEIVDYMCAFDVLVLPSRTVWNWKEQFGRVLIEAMACETPVVGSDSGEIPNVIGNAGFIFHEGEADGLAACLRRLMDNSSLRETLGRRGRERVLERFSFEKIARRTVEFYRAICNDGEAVRETGG